MKRLLLLVTLAWPLAASDLIAFSLREAATRNRQGAPDETIALAGITRLRGFVFDASTNDVVIIGEADASRKPLQLANLAVVLRSVLVVGEWPLVSIDPAPGGRQVVRFEGRIAGTTPGKILLDADVLLKRLALGLESPLEGASYFDRMAKKIRQNAMGTQGSSRLWFHPRSPAVEQRGRVFLIRDMDLGVQAQSIGGPRTSSLDPAAEEFASALTSGLAELFEAYPPIAALREIFEMTAIASGLREVKEADLAYWLHEFPVPAAVTPDEVTAFERSQKVGGLKTLRVRGGVEMQALLIRAGDGDADAIEELVLRLRPTPSTLSWRVSVTLPEAKVGMDEYAIDSVPGTPLDWKVITTSPSRADSRSAGADPPSTGQAKVGGVSADIRISESDFSKGSVKK